MSCKIGRVFFSVYKAKNLNDNKWNSAVLKKLVMLARQSYLRYGAVPLIDDFDNKSAVYLCRVNYSYQYKKRSILLEEWLSVRFVPGSEQGSMDDLNQHLYGGRSVSELIKAQLFPNEDCFQNNLVAISRICGIHPYDSLAPEKSYRWLPKKLKYKAISFALINKDFFSQQAFSYIIGVFREELLKELLRHAKFSLVIPKAHKLLHCRADKIYLNRDLLAYRYPGYFLNIRHFISLLKKLIKRKKISVTAIKKYIPFSNKVINKKQYKEILKSAMGMSNLLLSQGVIPGSKIDGKELRALVGKHVADGPSLNMIAVSDWQAQLTKI